MHVVGEAGAGVGDGEFDKAGRGGGCGDAEFAEEALVCMASAALSMRLPRVCFMALGVGENEGEGWGRGKAC